MGLPIIDFLHNISIDRLSLSCIFASSEPDDVVMIAETQFIDKRKWSLFLRFTNPESNDMLGKISTVEPFL
jgi:hypothetical protein